MLGRSRAADLDDHRRARATRRNCGRRQHPPRTPTSRDLQRPARVQTRSLHRRGRRSERVASVRRRYPPVHRCCVRDLGDAHCIANGGRGAPDPACAFEARTSPASRSHPRPAPRLTGRAESTTASPAADVILRYRHAHRRTGTRTARGLVVTRASMAKATVTLDHLIAVGATGPPTACVSGRGVAHNKKSYWPSARQSAASSSRAQS
jgi:hypothetical protein